MKMEENKLEQAFDEICEAENMSREDLESFFDDLMEKTEKRVMHSPATTIDLKAVNQQLRAVAAVFLLVASGILMMSCSKNFYWPAAKNVPANTFEMERGDMLVH